MAAMRNDARPIGAQDPLGAEHARDAQTTPDVDIRNREADEIGRPADDHRDDPRPTVAHDRQSHIVNEGAAHNASRDDADVDPVMPTGDSTLKTTI
jgi:hypothetical protein